MRLSPWIIGVLFVLLLQTMLVAQQSVNTQQFLEKPYSTRLSYETIAVSTAESMGLMGVQLELNNFLRENYYLGIGGFGAIEGDRGGFFTAGITPGIRHAISARLITDIGLFLGGGGGASAFPGDGLMLRGHGYLGYKLLKSHVWTGVAWNQISSKDLGLQWSVALSRQLSILLKDPQPVITTKIPNSAIANLKKTALQLEIAQLLYLPTAKYQGRNNSSIGDTISLLHLQIEKQWVADWQAVMSLSGANGDGADGYGSILLGLGYSKHYQRWSWYKQLKLGMAGGGNIDTGGGLMINSLLGCRVKLFNQWWGSSSIGYLDAYDGKFSAWNITTGLTYFFYQHHYMNKGEEISKKQLVSTQKTQTFQWFIENKTVIPKHSLTTKGGDTYEETIQFFGCGAKLPLRSNIDVLVATYWAYDGNVGAYAEGDIGLSFQRSISKSWTTGVDVSIGAAGGGGIDVNQGTIHQETLMLAYQLKRQTKLVTKAGWQGAFSSDGFQGPVVIVGLERLVEFL